MKEFLDRFAVPINVVSFEVFQLAAGPKLLIREVIEEPADTQGLPRSRPTVEAIRRQADAGNVLRSGRFLTEKVRPPDHSL